ncbi:MAG: hypothetical protein QOK37_1474 [Thermoanaerobaculia bacterium]|jgi:hypothetical protein|nr:hypothetical protein [Thermoanaerobaculia bacterium]
MNMASAVLNEYLAPGYTELSEVDIPDLRSEFEQAEHWLANHFLNSVLRGRYREGARHLALAYLRRTSGAFDAYHRARKLTLEFLDLRKAGKQPVRGYYVMIDAWESCFLQAGMAVDLFRAMIDGEKLFEKNDGSAQERAYTIANQIKHAASCVASGHVTKTDTVSLIVQNRGLSSYAVAITFHELAEILRDFSRVADRLQDPLSFVSASS